jgi:hypothetical protein
MSDLIGANQAQAMMRRVSPEGRERAARERQRRQQRSARLAIRLLLAAVVAAVAIGLSELVLGSISAPVFGTIAALFLIAAAVIIVRSRERPVPAGSLPAATLTALPETTAAWLEAQHPALPAPAVALADSIAARLQDLTRQVVRLNGDEPAAEAVRRLLGTELPDLIDRHSRVPPRLRGEAQDGGLSADAHLLSGLRIVDEEVGRLTAQLASGDVDALATRDRFLELKYQGEGISRG